jgi:hypothetical protein
MEKVEPEEYLFWYLKILINWPGNYMKQKGQGSMCVLFFLK